MAILCYNVLPVEFMDRINGAYLENNTLKLLDRLKNVHHVIADVLRPFEENDVNGILYTSKEQKLFRIHLVLGHIVKDSQKKDMVGDKYSNRTMKTCPRCHALAEYLKYSSTKRARISEETKQVISKHHTMCSKTGMLCHSRPSVVRVMRKKTKQKLDDMSINPSTR